MRPNRSIAVGLVMVTALVGCGRNPLVGKWALSKKQQPGAFCMVDTLEFTDKTATLSMMGMARTVTASFSHDGNTYSVTTPDGSITSFVVEGDGITMLQPMKCHYSPSS
jgi:hypothetical protein